MEQVHKFAYAKVCTREHFYTCTSNIAIYRPPVLYSASKYPCSSCVPFSVSGECNIDQAFVLKKRREGGFVPGGLEKVRLFNGREAFFQLPPPEKVPTHVLIGVKATMSKRHSFSLTTATS